MAQIPTKHFALAAALLISLAACGGGGSSSATSEDEQTASGGGGSPTVNPQTGSGSDNFVFNIDEAYRAATSTEFVELIELTIGRSVEALNAIPNVLNNTTVPVNYTQCGFANAFYSPSSRSITLCDELGFDAYGYFYDLIEEKNDDAIVTGLTRATNMMSFVTYHEIGHALDDISNLNAGGNFESVADAIAVVLSIQTGQPGASYDGGVFFLQDDRGSFADEHGSGIDRAGDILCWTLGSSARIIALLPELAGLFVEAGRDCVAEYASQYAFVSSLIPSIKDVPPVDSLSSRRTNALELFAERAKNQEFVIAQLKQN